MWNAENTSFLLSTSHTVKSHRPHYLDFQVTILLYTLLRVAGQKAKGVHSFKCWILLLEEVACGFRSANDVTINPLLVGYIKYGCCYMPSELHLKQDRIRLFLAAIDLRQLKEKRINLLHHEKKDRRTKNLRIGCAELEPGSHAKVRDFFIKRRQSCSQERSILIKVTGLRSSSLACQQSVICSYPAVHIAAKTVQDLTISVGIWLLVATTD